ncbi:MAG: hypothetical protein DSY46_06840 [Hydrogenimonas sp.]|nr:MAG: hypothetical protein DSY46_06840 [Hydrogenimonas sp.]
MQKIFVIPLFFLIFFLQGCTTHYYEAPQSALIVIKSPTLRYADMGFIYRGKRHVKVQVYASGKAVFTMTIGKRICVNQQCMSETQFYKNYLHAYYPKGTLVNIFLKRPIFGGVNFETEKGKGVQQIFENGKFDIIYTFDSTSSQFRDRTNHILIKIMER